MFTKEVVERGDGYSYKEASPSLHLTHKDDNKDEKG